MTAREPMMTAGTVRLPLGMVAVLAVVLLVLAAGGAWFYRAQERAARNEVAQRLTLIGRLKADQIADWRSERLGDGAILSDSPLFSQGVARFLADPREENARPLRASFRSLEAHYHYTVALLVDPAGRSLLSVNGKWEAYPGFEAVLSAALRGRTPVLSDLHAEALHPAAHVDVVAPLFAGDAQDGPPLGAVVLVSDAAEFLYPLIQFWPIPSATAETLLIRRDGNDVLFLNDLRHRAGAALTLRIPLSRTDVPSVMAVLGQQGLAEGNDYRGLRVVSVLLPVPDSPWFIVAKEDEAEVYAAWRSRAALMVGLLVALVGGLGAIGLVAWQRNQKGHYQTLYSAEAELRIALQQSEMRYRRLFEAAVDGILILDAETGIVLDVNPFLTRMLGCPRDQLCGRALWDIGSFKDIIASKSSFRTLQDRKRFRYEDVPLETSDGRRIDVELVSNVYLVDHTKVIQCNIRDLTEHKRAVALQERLMTAIEQAGETVMIADPTGAIQYVNPAFETVTGYSREEMLGQNPRILKSGKQDEAFYRDMWRTISAGGVFRGRMVNRRKNGTLFTLEATISQVCDSSGRMVGYVAVEREITEDLRLAEQSQQAQQMASLGRLADGMAHDFNNMLCVILGHAELALYNVNPSEPLYLDLQQVQKAARRCVETGRQVLAFGHKQTVVPQVLDVNETAEGIVKMLPHLIGGDIHLAWVPGTGVWPVKMDPSQLDQIMANLCVNARDSISGAGVVAIETVNVVLEEADCGGHGGFVPGEFVLLTISDDGAGMDRKTLDNLFEPLAPGTSLGLATVYGIVKQNNGFIDVYGEPGKGTTFKIYLPRHKGETVDSLKGSTVRIPPGNGEIVLIVEDEVAVLELSKTMLERLGYAVLTAGTTGEAMRLVAAHAGEIRLLITEVVVPETNGRDLADQAHTLSPGIRTLFMSGYRADVIAQGGVADEGVRVIQKPFSMADLALKVREALDRP